MRITIRLRGWVMDGLGYVGAMHRSPRTMVQIKNICDTYPLTERCCRRPGGCSRLAERPMPSSHHDAGPADSDQQSPDCLDY